MASEYIDDVNNVVDAVLKIKKDGMRLFQELPPDMKRAIVAVVHGKRSFSLTEHQTLFEMGYIERGYGGWALKGDGYIVKRFIELEYRRALWWRRECWSYYRKHGINWR